MSLNIQYIEADFDISELENRSWETASEVVIERYWSGKKAPVERHTSVRLLWSSAALYVRFSANQYEPLIISENPNLEAKTDGLWDRDVCEIFIAPESGNTAHYFEFEIAPTGEWLDLEITISGNKRETNWDYYSEMKCAAEIGITQIRVAAKIHWNAFGKPPRANEIWAGNLFRILGSGESRGYLAWQPTETDMPNFHVPSKFGEFKFQK